MKGAVAAVVPAAGQGRRMGGTVNKPFVLLRGMPLLAHTLLALERSPAIRWIVLVVSEGAQRDARGLISRYGITKAIPPCAGGPSRAESVARGTALAPRDAQWILVHDGARPCLTPQLVQDAVRAARRDGAVACGLPAMLTVKAVDERAEVRLTLDRDHLWFVQTPQVFRRDWLAQALRDAGPRLSAFPDDAAILESAGFRVRMVPGDPLNLKVTTPEDLVLAEAVLASRERVRASVISPQPTASRGWRSEDRRRKKIHAAKA
jgi:2-C-methyl-D-erythritol 4-phosphate cytidylyltransferase